MPPETFDRGPNPEPGSTRSQAPARPGPSPTPRPSAGTRTANILRFLPGWDAAQCDGLLLELAGTADVDETSIVARCTPRRGHHGHHAVTWTQNGRNHTVEGVTLHTALRRAVAAAGTRSATAEV